MRSKKSALFLIALLSLGIFELAFEIPEIKGLKDSVPDIRESAPMMPTPTKEGVTKHKITAVEFARLKSEFGIYEEGRNYNQLVDGHGTGLRPPREDEWAEIAERTYVVDSITYAGGVSSPSSVDQSAQPWFPPIGDQDVEKSCVGWSVGYYTKTFQEAKERGWDLSGAEWEGDDYGYPTESYQDKIISPDFVYHLINNGINGNTNPFAGIQLVCFVGASSWENMPYDPLDSATWPSQEAWNEAPLYRGASSGAQIVYTDTDVGLANLKNWIASENLALIGIDSDFYSVLTSEDLWTTDNYAGIIEENHANTIVGYDDDMEYVENGEVHYGAFKVANSWGIDFTGETVPDGFYWISYEAMKQRIEFALIYEDVIGYVPTLEATFQIDHSKRSECDIQVGMGNPSSPIVTKSFSQCIQEGAYPFCSNNIVFDITEFEDFVSTVYGQTFFLRVLDGGTTTTGTITTFEVNLQPSSDAPCPTIADEPVYLDLIFDSESANQKDILVVSDNDGSNFARSGTSLVDFELALDAAGFEYAVWDQTIMGHPSLDSLTSFKLVIWTCGDYWDTAVDSTDAETLESYVAGGGNLLLEGEDIGLNHVTDDFMTNVAHAAYEGVDNTGADGLTVTNPDHPVTDGLPTSFTWLIDPPWDDGVSPTNGGAEVIQYTDTSYTAVAVFEGDSSGSVVYYAFPLYSLAETERQLLATNSIKWLLPKSFDFGTSGSPVEAGYIQVTETTLYSVSTGYGWASTTGLSCRDRDAPDDLRRDLVQSTTEHTFNVDLANGDYTVTVTIGDQNYAHDNIDVYAETVLMIDDLDAAAGSFMEMAFGTTVLDGQLNLRILDDGGTDGNWVITALTVEPGLPSPPPTEGYFDFGTADSPVEADYVQVTEATLYSASKGYGWTSTAGLSSVDRTMVDNLLRDFVQGTTEHTLNVDLVNGDYQVNVTMCDHGGYSTTPTHDLIDVYAEDVLKINDFNVPPRTVREVTFYTTISDRQLNLRILDDGGSDASWLINALTVQPGTPTLPTEGYFDFGKALSGLHPGYMQVIETTFYSDSWGYGWTSTAGVSSRNRGSPDALKMDLVQGTTEHTFNVDLANGDYNVTLIIGDQSYMHDLIDVYVEDVLEINDYTPEVGAFPALTFYTSISDEQLNVRILDDGGADASWVINALAVEPGTIPTLPTERAFDFGPYRSPVASGFIRVNENTIYSAYFGSAAYGWSTTSGLDSRERGEADYLRQDFIQSTTEHLFKVDLANGDYNVTLIIGDQSYMHDLIDVYAEDVLVIDDLTAAAGAFQEVTFYLTLADEQLNLRILDDGGADANWVINGLIVQPGTPPTLPTEAAFDFGTDFSPVETDYSQVTEATLYSSALGYGWTSTTGLTCRDRGLPDSLRCDLVQSTTEHTFNVDLANGDYTVTVTIGDQSYVHDLVDVLAEGSLMIDDLDAAAGSFMEMAFGVTITDEQLNLGILDDGGTDTNWVIAALTVESGLPPAPPTEGYFDFGTSDSPVESTYTPVTESTLYSAVSGYGWASTAGLQSRDRGAPNNLNRDLVQSTTEHTFNVDLANGDYTVTITIGDQSYTHDMIDVYAEDVIEASNVNSAAGSFQEVVFETTVSDGQLNLTILDNGGTDTNWVINALTIVVASP